MDSAGDYFAQGRGFPNNQLASFEPLFQEEEVWGLPVGFEGSQVLVQFRESEDIRLPGQAGDFESQAAGFGGTRFQGGFGDEPDEIIHPFGGCFDGDDQGDHGEDGVRGACRTPMRLAGGTV